MSLHATNDDGWSSDDDGWGSDDEVAGAAAAPAANVPWSTADGVECPKSTHSEHEALPDTLQLVNFSEKGGSFQVLRCKPVKESGYPTVALPDALRGYQRVLLTMVMYHHGLEHLDVRFPNPKHKDHTYRGRSGLWVDASKTHVVGLLKKAVDKTTKQQLAFRLGTEFLFETGGIDPSFIMVATPLVNGQFKRELAVRSKPFFVKSKENDKNRGPHKRRKKAREVQQLNTDVESARGEKESLEQEHARMTYLNNQHAAFMRKLNTHARNLPEGPAKIALLHATRGFKTAATVSL